LNRLGVDHRPYKEDRAGPLILNEEDERVINPEYGNGRRWLEESEGRTRLGEETFSDKAGEAQVSYETEKIVMKERPKVGDRVEFRLYGVARIGTLVAVVAETGVHFLAEMSTGRFKFKRIAVNDIIRILPEAARGSSKADGEPNKLNV
ncbi:unnamed protein product, partial [marine sediment metagenome]